jgi:hypothetical protein
MFDITAATPPIPSKSATEARIFDAHFVFLLRDFASELIAIPYRSMRQLY